MKLYLARHCRTDWNDQYLVQGHRDIPLNARGYNQALQLGRALAAEAEPPTQIVCSDLIRAIETASIVATSLKHTSWVRPDRRLRECSFGSIDGMTYADSRKITPENCHKECPDGLAYDFAPWGGENGQQVLTRQVDAINEAKRLFPDDRLLIIGHGRSLSTLLYGLGHGRDVPDQGTFRVIDFI